LGTLFKPDFVPAVRVPKKKPELRAYQSMRDFGKTPEPAGTLRRLSTEPTFVVQHHAARGDHYDFRLELAGVA